MITVPASLKRWRGLLARLQEVYPCINHDRSGPIAAIPTLFFQRHFERRVDELLVFLAVTGAAYRVVEK